jgi:hypothetical protein
MEGNGMNYGVKSGGARFTKLARTMVLGMSIMTILDTNATEPAAPAGYVTISRDVPTHNAFRAGDLGRPTNVATAREDIVVASTRLQSHAPQSLPDSALDSVGPQVPNGASSIQRIDTAPPAAIGHAGPSIAGMGAVLGRATSSPIESVVMQALPAGASTRAAAPVGNAMPIMPGIR